MLDFESCLHQLQLAGAATVCGACASQAYVVCGCVPPLAAFHICQCRCMASPWLSDSSAARNMPLSAVQRLIQLSFSGVPVSRLLKPKHSRRRVLYLPLLAAALLVTLTCLLHASLRRAATDLDAVHWARLLHVEAAERPCSFSYRFFIYPLPFVFNYVSLPATILLSPNSSSIFNNGNLHVYANEIAIHFALQDHPCRTYDPEAATFFFLPAYPFYLRVARERHAELEAPITEALDVLHRALTAADEQCPKQSSSASRAGAVGCRWKQPTQSTETQTAQAVDALFEFADDWAERDYNVLTGDVTCRCHIRTISDSSEQSVAIRESCPIESSSCVENGYKEHVHPSAAALPHYPLRTPPLPVVPFWQRDVRPTLDLPSRYKKYFRRRQLCDHVLVSSRGSNGWDDDQYWTRRQATSTILLTNQLSSREDYFDQPLTAKNVAIGQTTDLQNAFLITYSQLQHQLVAVGRDDVVVLSTPSSQTHADRSQWQRAAEFQRRYQQYLQQAPSIHGDEASLAIQPNHIRWPRSADERPCFTYFYGTQGPYTTRHHLKHMLLTYDSTSSVIAEMDSTNRRDIGSISYTYAYLQSVFCWIAPGDAYFTNRLYDVIAAGCLPLIINDMWYLPYTDVVDWSQFSLRFRESDTRDKPAEVMQYLHSLSQARIVEMQVNMYNARHALMYSLHEFGFHSQPGDAIDSMLQGLESRVEYAKTCRYQDITMDLDFTDLS